MIYLYHVYNVIYVWIGVAPKAAAAATPHFEKPKVVIRPAIAPKTEPKVQYVKVMGSKPIQQHVSVSLFYIRCIYFLKVNM